MIRGFGSYCDEFGHADDPQKRVMGIAGLMAWSDEWAALTERWLKLQRDEKVPTFHMTDFVHHTEDFSDKRWESEYERQRVLALFLDAIAEANVAPIGASVSLKDFRGLTEEQRKALVSPYHVAFQEVTSNLTFAAANKALQSAASGEEFFGNRVAMVYAKLKKFGLEPFLSFCSWLRMHFRQTIKPRLEGVELSPRSYRSFSALREMRGQRNNHSLRSTQIQQLLTRLS